MLNVMWVDDLDDSRLAEVRELLRAAAETDGWPELPDSACLPADLSGGTHLLASSGTELVGYAHLDTRGDAFGRQVAELIVRPADRRAGIAAAMRDALIEKAGVVTPGDQLRVWSHGDHPDAARLAQSSGFTRVRELIRMHLWLGEDDVAAPPLSDDLRLRSFIPGRDEQAVIDVNARAFSWHPEQGGLTVDDLRATERENWFDPNGFFLVEDGNGRVLGFHWTKVHPPSPQFDDDPVGEVYVVGVDPEGQGRGLGKVLTAAGLRYLQAIGLHRVILYVEGDNAPAIAVYERLGFIKHDVGVQYGK